MMCCGGWNGRMPLGIVVVGLGGAASVSVAVALG
jgi:hypothetical protein